MNRVWATQELKGGHLLLMLALADHANDAGECWPSEPHLAEKARIEERHVRRVIVSLADDGYITVISPGKGRGKNAHYQLFPPEKADILSKRKADILSESQKKADILSKKRGHSQKKKADISDTKADISNEIPSHAGSEPSIEPTTNEPTTESSSLQNEDEKPSDPISAAWLEHYRGKPMPTDGRKVLDRLAANHGIDAVVHAIRAGAAAKANNIEYIAKCARNYIPPAPETSYSGYWVEIPAAPPAGPELLPLPLPTASTADPWAQTLADFPGIKWLEGSRLIKAADVAGIPLYHIQVCDPDSVGWLTNRMGGQLRRSLSITMGERVLIEIVAAEKETAQ